MPARPPRTSNVCTDGDALRLRGDSGDPARPKVIAVVPAHNEQASIAATIEGLQSQTRPLDDIIVMADNCTDDTERIARACGVTVIATVDNSARKAGALNQALTPLLAADTCPTYILPMDADTVLPPGWVESAVQKLDTDWSLGAVCASYEGREGRGWLALMQRIEFATMNRRVRRRGGRVDVLSGTASLLRTSVARRLIRDRGGVYDEGSRVEDFELTLAVRRLGWRVRSYRALRAETDVMETFGDYARQRIRWQRGALETLRRYGFGRLTWRLWLAQFRIYTMTFILGLTGWMLLMIAQHGMTWNWWLLAAPIVGLSETVEAWAAGRKARWAAALVIPVWGYDLLRTCVFWWSLAQVLRRTNVQWNS